MKVADNLDTIIALLQEKLPYKLPGVEAQQIMAPSFRNDYEVDEDSLRESGVLLF